MPVDGLVRRHRPADTGDDPGEGDRLALARGQQPVQGRRELRTGAGVAGRDLHSRLGGGEQREVLSGRGAEGPEGVARETAVEDDDDPVGAGVAQLGHDVVAPGQGVDEGVVPVPGHPGAGEHQVEVAAVGSHDAVSGEVDHQQAGDLLTGRGQGGTHPERVDGGRAAVRGDLHEVVRA